ncbi:DUF6056 family protein [Streptomyces sp. NPDC032472]|uniref:DUF6056 family protein n=1 Tax=Streptomyces sp. NPDC032472 TaxID=3155018 RepID=UPI00340E5D81
MSTAPTAPQDARTHSSPRGGTAAPVLPRLLLPGTCAVLVSAAGALIAVGCFLGLYVRPTSDDWCAAWKSRDLGVLGITSDFYSTQNGRVTNAFLSGVVYADGLTGIKVLPTAIVVAFTTALVLLAREFTRLLGANPKVLLLLTCSLLIQALLYYAGTRNYQVLLWAPATISHTLPSVIGIWALLLGIATVRTRSPAVRAAGFAGAFLVAFAIGTLSEPFALVSGLLAAAVALLVPRNRRAFTWCLLWCSGLACGLIVLYTSPGARSRRARQPAAEPLLSAKELGAAFGDWLHMWEVVTGQWAYLGAAAAGVLLGLGSRLRFPPPTRLRIPLLLLPVPVVVLGSFAVVLGLRSGYGPTGWTYARAWTSYLVPMELALCGYGALLGAWGRRRLADHRAPVAAATVSAGCLALASAAVLVPNVQYLTTTTVTRAAAWDAQNSRIRKEAARGAADIGYTPLHIGNLAEPFFTSAYERDWAAACVAKWYGIPRIHPR